MDLDRIPGRKGLCGTVFGTRFSRPVNLRVSRDWYLRDWVFAGWAETGHAGLHGSAFLVNFSYFTWKKREREWEENDSCDFSPIKHKEFRRWWFERLRLQLQRWWFELGWCFDLVFSFYYIQLWIALLQCDISCLGWLVLFSVLWCFS